MLKSRNEMALSHDNYRSQNYHYCEYSDTGNQFTDYLEHEKWTSTCSVNLGSFLTGTEFT